MKITPEIAFDELMTRMTNDALWFIVRCKGKKITYKEIFEELEKMYPNKGYYK